jgi:hypothetical protein
VSGHAWVMWFLNRAFHQRAFKRPPDFAMAGALYRIFPQTCQPHSYVDR